MSVLPAHHVPSSYLLSGRYFLCPFYIRKPKYCQHPVKSIVCPLNVIGQYVDKNLHMVCSSGFVPVPAWNTYSMISILLELLAFKIIVCYWFSTISCNFIVKHTPSLSHSHTHMNTHLGNVVCSTWKIDWHAGDVVMHFFHSPQKEPSSHRGNKCIKPLLCCSSRFVENKRKMVLYKTVTHSSEWPAAVSLFPEESGDEFT